MIARKLSAVNTMAVASPAYLDQHGTPQTPEELKNHQELRFGLRERKGWAYTGPDGTRGEVEMPSTLRATSGDFLCAAALAHHGIAILPGFIVQPAVARGELVELLTDYQWPELNAYALYPSSRHLPRRVRELIDHLLLWCNR